MCSKGNSCKNQTDQRSHCKSLFLSHRDVHSGAELIINASDVFSPCLSIPNSQRERRKYESIFLTTKSKCQLVSSWCQFSAWETIAVVLEAYAGKNEGYSSSTSLSCSASQFFQQQALSCSMNYLLKTVLLKFLIK